MNEKQLSCCYKHQGQTSIVIDPATLKINRFYDQYKPVPLYWKQRIKKNKEKI
jgi:hypothetical protein